MLILPEPRGAEYPAIGLGTSPFGGGPHYAEVDEEQAVQTVLRAMASPITLIDTSNSYGAGRSERIIGEAVRRLGELPDGALISTKVDPLPGPRIFPPGARTFGGARVRQSAEESLTRLGLDNVPLLYLHDPELFPFEELVAPGGAVEALVALKASGVASSIGVAGGDPAEMKRYMELGVFDVLLNHNRYTLVNRSARELMGAAWSIGVFFVNAAPFGGGILAKGTTARPTYKYQSASSELTRTVDEMQSACEHHGVALRAAALQFSLREPLVASTIVGMSRPERVEQVLDDAAQAIPVELWEELDSIAARLIDSTQSKSD